MQNHKCNEVVNAFPIFKLSRLVRVHTDSHHNGHNKMIFSERELMFVFDVVLGPSVVCLSSVTFVHPTQAIEIFGNVSTPFGTLAICDPSVKILRRSSQGNLSVGGGVNLNQRGVEKCSDFGPFEGYISETVQDRR